MANISSTTFKKELRKFRIEVENKDKKSGQTIRLTTEEEIELKFPTSSPYANRKPVDKKPKIIQIDKDGKSYNFSFVVERVRKGWLKDTPLNYSVKPMTADFKVINQKIDCPQLG